MDDLELWGGAECTINRVGNVFINQSQMTGHDQRLSDLDLFHALGITALRTPILWEDYAAQSDPQSWWAKQEQKLNHMRRLGITPILTLMHHGSGPHPMHLLHPQFADHFTAFAARVADMFPWVNYWTPINEPLTTARFSALYGLWYPHKKDEQSFLLALLNQIEAIKKAMAAIRIHNPQAKLVQTEDLGKTYATPPLQAQADYDNQRRWLTWDLLSGHVNAQHSFWSRMQRMGFAPRLQHLIDSPCPPDIIGINHYLTSDRFLDHRLSRYPQHLHGGNGQQAYADVEAIRVLDPAPQGLEGALGEAAERYGLEVAITESHNGCTRDEQMRWALEAWQTAQRLRQDGLHIRAVTIWALLGNYGWDKLLTCANGRYECGTFDVRGAEPRHTAMVSLLSHIRDADHHHSVLSGKGWWQRDIRLTYTPHKNDEPAKSPSPIIPAMAERKRRPLLITGATGTLGQAFAKACALRDIDYILTSREMLDIHQEISIKNALELYQPWAVINAAAWVRADDAETLQDECFRTNYHGAYALSRACAERDLHIVNFSTDLVFNGAQSHPYLESDTPSPLNIYGMSKFKIEKALQALGDRQLTIRTAAFFSPFDPYNFAYHVVRALGQKEVFATTDDYIVSPTYVPDLVHMVLDLLIDKEHGIWQLSNGQPLSWAGFAQHIANDHGLDEQLVEIIPGKMPEWTAERPTYSALGSEKGQYLPPLEDAISRFLQEMQKSGHYPKRRQRYASR